MFVPGPSKSATTWSTTPRRRRRLEERNSLERRRGGGGGGKGGGGGSKGGSSSSGSKGGGSSESSSSGSKGGSGSSSSSSSSGSVRKSPITTSGTSESASSYGFGGGKMITIPSGQLFAGRQAGGGNRNQVYGTSIYGSGYPGINTRGVDGRPFPFYFWPLVWGATIGYNGPHTAYLHSTDYGSPDNTSRTGGAMMYANFVSNSTNATTFHVVADNTTVASLIIDITSNCSSFLNTGSSSTSPITFNDSDSGTPKPEQTVQYYRASTVALTLDGYNNSATFNDDNNDNDTMSPLPDGIDMDLLNCLNGTVGEAVPLIDGAAGLNPMGLGNMGLIGLVWMFLWLAKI